MDIYSIQILHIELQVLFNDVSTFNKSELHATSVRDAV